MSSTNGLQMLQAYNSSSSGGIDSSGQNSEYSSPSSSPRLSTPHLISPDDSYRPTSPTHIGHRRPRTPSSNNSSSTSPISDNSLSTSPLSPLPIQSSSPEDNCASTSPRASHTRRHISPPISVSRPRRRNRKRGLISSIGCRGSGSLTLPFSNAFFTA